MNDAAKARRIEFRTTERTRTLIDRAAAVTQVSLTEFAEQSLLQAAERVLADQNTFVLSDKARAEWDALNDRPARSLPGLKKLLQRPSPFGR